MPETTKNNVQMAIENVLLVGYIAILSFLFNSCTIYYPTSEIDAQLKSNVQSLNSNFSTITGEFTKMKTEYHKLDCIGNKDPYLTAEQLISSMENDIEIMDKIKNEIISEYGNFSRYTKGKAKIESGTIEWKKLKTTKKKFKTDLKQIQKQGDVLSKKGTEFNSFAAEQLMPKINYYVVADYTNKCKQAIEQIERNKMSLGKSINENEQKVKPMLSKFANSHPEQTGIIRKEFAKIRKELGSIDQIHAEFNDITNSFEKKTRGKDKIYNCSQEWSLVELVENGISRTQNNLKQVEQRIRSSSNSIELLMNELSGQ